MPKKADPQNVRCRAGVPPAQCSRDGRTTRIVTVALALGVLAAFCAPGPARGEERLYNQTPYDQVTLDENNNNEVLKLVPLNLEKMPKESAEIDVRKLDEPDKVWVLKWSYVAKDENGNYKYRTFPQLILDKANELVRMGEFDEAFDYFEFLKANHPALGQPLDDSINNYLRLEGEKLYGANQFDAALARFWELHDRAPGYPRLQQALTATTEKLLEKYEAAEDYSAIRELLGNLARAEFPEPTAAEPAVAKAFVARWEAKLAELAGAERDRALQARQQGNLQEAARLGRHMVQIWPQLASADGKPGGRELMESIHRQYPRAVVGVSTPPAPPRPAQLYDWAARRSGRLVYRTLVEFIAPGRQGGIYRSPMGTVTTADSDNQLSLLLEPGVDWATGHSTLTGYDVSRQLLAMADPATPLYSADWAGLFDGASASDVYRVKVAFRRQRARPDALLQIVPIPYVQPLSSTDSPPSNGPYVVDSTGPDEACYTASPQYFAAEDGQPKEIVERYFRRGVEAVRALRSGEIDLVDRLNPWQVAKVQALEDVAVEPYAAPLVHCLVPTNRNRLLANRAFRRALVFALDRDKILATIAGGDATFDGRVLSGPFAAGNERISYAYDTSIAPRRYDPRLAIALAQMAFRKEISAEKERVKSEGGNAAAVTPESLGLRPRFVLAYPASETARVACTAIKRQIEALNQLEPLGLQIELQERDPGAPPETWHDRYDLVYVELAMWEPVVDAHRLLSERGPLGRCGPYMTLALSRLEHPGATEAGRMEWRRVADELKRIHRLAHDEVTVIPLWEITDHFAYRRDVQGAVASDGSPPVCPYQYVEKWQIPFRYLGEQE